MNRRQTEGAETFSRLREWTRDQAASERLAAHLLRIEGFKSIDPSHPLGGPDGLKDVVCERNGKKWIGAAFFPRGQRSFGATKAKFHGDLTGVAANATSGLVFVTNQELRISERQELEQLAGPADADVEILHLERIRSILDSPASYGIRLEFLDIEMTRDEQLAFFAQRDAAIEELQKSVDLMLGKMEDLARRSGSGEDNVLVPLAEIREFKSILDSIAGSSSQVFNYVSPGLFGALSGHMSGLRVPLSELREFVQILDRITGSSGVSFGTAVSTITGGAILGHVSQLRVPLSEIKEYEAILDRLIAKRRLLDAPPSWPT
jgi:hypothetical protein